MNWYKRLKFAFNPSKFNPSPEVINQIDKWYASPPEGEGFPISEIAEKLNISSDTLKRWFIRNNRKIRTNAEQFSLPFSKNKKNKKYIETRQKMSLSEIEKIKELYLSGYGIDELAKTFNLYSTTLRRILREENIPIRSPGEASLTNRTRERRRKISQEDIQTAINLYLDGYSSSYIADKFNVSATAIRNLLKRENIKLKESTVSKAFSPNDEVIRKIDKWYALPPEGDGLSIGEIARRLNIPRINLRNWFKRTGRKRRTNVEQFSTPFSKQQFIERTKWVPDEQTIIKIDKMYALPPEGEGLPVIEIANRLNIPREHLRYWFEKTGRNIRTNPEQSLTPYTTERRKEYWKTHNFWEELENFLQRHIQKFPLEQREQEYERKKREILWAINASDQKKRN